MTTENFIGTFIFILASSLTLGLCKSLNNAKSQRIKLVMTATTEPSLTFNLKLSPMVENMAVSKTIEIHAITKEMEKSGPVFSLCVGEPDYEPPKEVLEATGRAAVSGKTKYTSVNGEVALRTAITIDLNKRKSIKYTADQIVVSNGAKQSVLQSLLSIVSPNDQVLIPSPYWTSYPDMVKICNAVPVVVETYPEENYVLTAQSLKKALQENPRVTCLILCNPSNPTGCVADYQSLLELAEVLSQYPKVAIISDEIYERLTYDVPHTSFASLPGMFDRTITINGFSKSHSMTGFRLGYSASNTAIAKANAKIQSQMTSCASSISQYAGLVALNDVSETWMSDRVTELKYKRDYAFKLLKDIPNISCPKPDGAFYLLPDVSFYFHTKTPSGVSITNSHELCLQLLKEHRVALVSGDAFGADKCLRISYAASCEMIESSLSRLTSFLASLQKQ